MSHPVTLRLLPFMVLISVWVAAPAPASVRLAVNCDAGDDLQDALDEVADKGGGRIRVSGTCSGSFRWSSDAFVEVIGHSPATSVLQAGSGIAMSATKAGFLVLRNLRLTGGQGVRASDALRVIQVDQCEVAGTALGIHVTAGAAALVADSNVAGSQAAIRISEAAAVVERGQLFASAIGARLISGILFLDSVEVRDNDTGVLAGDRSDVTVVGGRFANMGQTLLSISRGSRLALHDTQLGGPDDADSVSIRANHGSAVEVAYSGPGVDIWGSATLHNDSYMSFSGTSLHGSILLRSFSKLVLEGTVTGGSVQCGSAADAWCGASASTFTLDCPGVPDPCVPVAGATPPAVPSRPKPPEFELPQSRY